MKKNALKKLSLHRETLRSLGQDLLPYAVGEALSGGPYSWCNTCECTFGCSYTCDTQCQCGSGSGATGPTPTSP
jgi:hypothetical protein